MDRLEALAAFTDEPGRLTRLYLTPAHKAAALQVQRWMEEAGMTARLDAIGNVVGRYEGNTPGLPALLLGSHIDTVRDAGKYDGNLGVITAVAAVAELHRAGERLPFAIEVLAFGDEEGVRFPVTLTGSRAVAGTLDPAALDAEDQDGVSVREALQRFGLNPFDIPSIPRRKEAVLGYVEVHIEQGPVLEAEGLPVGVVTAINGASRFAVEVRGVAGHAGTVPMNLRKDALAAAVEMISALERTAQTTADLVATVGRIEALPGAVNVVPGAARFTIDIRSPSDAVRRDAIARLEETFRGIAARRGTSVSLERSYDEPAASCAPWLVEQLAAAVERAGIKPRRLPSGAGHDGLAMAGLCPIGMLFVRCKEGISHNPAEAITAEDADVAVRVLLDFLRRLRLSAAAQP
jgi:hydantoinase/carbamoylase family amidase